MDKNTKSRVITEHIVTEYPNGKRKIIDRTITEYIYDPEYDSENDSENESKHNPGNESKHNPKNDLEIDCFTDASHRPKHNYGFISYIIGDNEIKNKFLKNITVSALELEGVQTCIDECLELYPNVKRINIYTDSQTAVMNKNFKKLYDNVNIIKVAGHIPSHEKTDIDHKFSLVDKQSRKLLRKYVDENE